MNGTLFFTANDGVSGNELWKSDGTAAGTVLVKDIYAGRHRLEPLGLVAVGGTLFFTANDGVNGTELWKSDGTAAGTVLVKDIYARQRRLEHQVPDQRGRDALLLGLHHDLRGGAVDERRDGRRHEHRPGHLRRDDEFQPRQLHVRRNAALFHGH